jgi:hypothetical protein
LALSICSNRSSHFLGNGRGWDSRVLALFSTDGLQEVMEKVLSVLRSTLGFRMELDRENGTSLMADTFIGAIVGIDKESLPALGHITVIQSITVVLRSDVATAVIDADSRLVMTTVTKGEFVGVQTSGHTKEKVTHANTEDGLVPSINGNLQVVDSLGTHGRATRTIGNEKTIILILDLVEVIVPRKDSDSSATSSETTQDVLLDTTINNSDLDITRLVVVKWHLGGNASNQVLFVRIREGNVLRGMVNKGIVANSNLGKSGSLLSQQVNYSASVHTADGRDTKTLAPLTERFNGSPMRILSGIVVDNDTLNLNTFRFKVLEKTKLISGFTGNTVVSYKRARENLATSFRLSIGVPVYVPMRGWVNTRI